MNNFKDVGTWEISRRAIAFTRMLAEKEANHSPSKGLGLLFKLPDFQTFLRP